MHQDPPTLAEFNTQVTGLIEELGAAAFCGSPGNPPRYTLFVEGDSVLAEPMNAPRHPYGVYCTLSDDLSEEQAAEHVRNWLESGEAYADFLSMNVCRYDC
ncbi:MAG: hypothetical protein AB2598_16625 [Candidatus Thiodiazotropha sp.]